MKYIRAIIDLDKLQEDIKKEYSTLDSIKELEEKHIKILFLTDRQWDEIKMWMKARGLEKHECQSYSEYYKSGVNWKLDTVKSYQKGLNRKPIRDWDIPTEYLLFYGDEITRQAVEALNDTHIKTYPSLRAIAESVDVPQPPIYQARLKESYNAPD